MSPARTGPPDPAGDGHVVLVGMMGAGKTTGRALAARLGRPLVDSDARVEACTGATGGHLAARDGVAALHELEASILLEALASPEPAVVTAAASVVESQACRRALAGATVVWLDVPVDELCRRMATGEHRRPMSARAAEAALARRLDRFAEVADVRLDGRRASAEIVAAVLSELGRS